MSRWFRYCDDALNDPGVQMLSGDLFKAAFFARLAGADNEFTPFLKAYRSRPQSSRWRELRVEVFRRDDFTCQYCGERGGRLECDHRVPVTRGGSDDLENLATACFRCNRAKRNKLVEEWIR